MTLKSVLSLAHVNAVPCLLTSVLECPGGQTYQVCGNPCERTCRNIANGDTCQADCVEGCNCPDGQTLNDQGVCVDIAQCPCIFGGRQLAAGTTTLKGAEIW